MGPLPGLVRLPCLLFVAGLALSPVAAAQEQYERIMVGTWQFETTGEADSEIEVTIEYMANGRYLGEREVDLGDIGQIVVLEGTWSVEAVSKGRFALTRTERRGSPPQTEILTVVDDKTLLNEAAGYEVRRAPQRVRDPNAQQIPEQ